MEIHDHLRLHRRESSPVPPNHFQPHIYIYNISFYIRMSRPAAEILQKFYLRLRDQSASADGTPITARQLESLVRLAEARARLDLREEITAQDALVSCNSKPSSVTMFSLFER